ncbi:hypothetical protein E5288_WYG009078 [Bos mutus]|uniref:Uncharacterized protein n=1 Tax=Bos mutus TaxID=72004 RepID=A0A6B0QVQ1_9CETA|nr:hypothetical protein [Bos mutus]
MRQFPPGSLQTFLLPGDPQRFHGPTLQFRWADKGGATRGVTWANSVSEPRVLLGQRGNQHPRAAGGPREAQRTARPPGREEASVILGASEQNRLLRHVLPLPVGQREVTDNSAAAELGVGPAPGPLPSDA